MIGYFYDIESLENVFTLVNFKENTNECDVFYLIDNESEIMCEKIAHAIEGEQGPTQQFETVPVSKERFLELLTEGVYEANKNFRGKINIYDLHTSGANALLAETFGLSDAMYTNNPNARSNYSDRFRLRCDTDTDYDESTDYYLFGYNSYNYDTTMLALYMYDTIPNEKDARQGKFKPITAKLMRQYNDELFSDKFKKSMSDRLRYSYVNPMYPQKGFSAMNFKDPKAIIRKNMLMTGRHIDVARLNEKQAIVGLKRLLGMLGYQIRESNKLKPGQAVIRDLTELIDLIAYNVSDCVNLKQLFNHKTYQSGFTLKKQLLKDYPELVYQRKRTGEYAPEVSPYTVRNDRLTIDSSSAQLSTKSLCPYDHLKDYDTVSFWYPSENKAKEMGIPRINVLEESKKFFYSHFPQPELRAKFDEIYNYYKSIEGKNFNSSKNYLIDHGVDPNMVDAQSYLPEDLQPYNLSNMPSPNTCMFYYDKDGKPSRCFVNFSTGGIHGAEYNQEMYEYDLECYEEKMIEWQSKVDLIDKVRSMFATPADLKAQKGVVIDDIKYKPSDFIKSEAVIGPNGLKTKERNYFWKDYPKQPKKPEPFEVSATGNWNVNKNYTYTSAAPANHEDFESYYPNLLRMMEAFLNEGLGYDRYGEIFDNKTKFGHMMKDKQYTEEMRELYSVMRNGTKLVLNSASGAADASFESNIRMNNKIISMRIIGQLFTWRIGQAQTIEGANMISTNTDGLYSVLEATLNDEILARESDAIHVKIEPEPMFLISKDSNNRMEIELKDGQLETITGASGGTLGCRRGPNPEKSLAHPAIIDWALAEYLILAAVNYKDAGMDKPFSDELGRSIISSAREQFADDVHTLCMFQNVIASSPGTQTFVFATADTDPDTPIPLQHYNRCFIVKDKSKGAYHLKKASAKAITDASMKKRKKAGEKPKQNDPIAASILDINGVKISSLPPDKEAAISKITGVEEAWYMRICNEDMYYLSEEQINDILDNLDYEKYLSLLRDSFENNWRNAVPERKSENTSDTDLMDMLFGDDADTNAASTNSVSETDMPAETDIVENSVENVENNIKTSSQPGNDASLKDASDEEYVSTELPANAPKLYTLKRTVITNADIAKGERQLNLGGVRIGAEHEVLVKLLKAMTDTDID